MRNDIDIRLDVEGAALARAEMDSVGRSARDLGGSFGSMGAQAKAGAGAAALAVATMAVDVAIDLATVGLEIDLMGKRVETVFGSSAPSVEAWAETVNRSFGMSAQRVAGLAANVGDLLVPLGLTREEAALMSIDVLNTASALDLWSTSTTSVAQATEIVNASLLGERERLKGLGISLNQAELDAALLTRGLEDLEGQERKLAEATVTLELVQQKSADAIAFANSAGADQQLVVRELQAEWGQLKDDMGEAFLPVAIDVGRWFLGDGIEALNAFYVQGIEPVVGGVLDLIDVFEKLGSAVSWLWDGGWNTIQAPLTAATNPRQPTGGGYTIMRPVDHDDGTRTYEPDPDHPGFAMGGVVPARPGGTTITAGEAGEDEYVTPASRMFLHRPPPPAAPMLPPNQVAAGNNTTIIVNVSAGAGASAATTGREIAAEVERWMRRNGSLVGPVGAR